MKILLVLLAFLPTLLIAQTDSNLAEKPGRLLVSLQLPEASEWNSWFTTQLEHELSQLSSLRLVTQTEMTQELARARVQPETRDSSDRDLLMARFRPTHTLHFEVETPVHSSGRGPWYKWGFGQRSVHMAARFHAMAFAEATPDLRGPLLADTSWNIGWCGLLECQVSPIGTAERLSAEKALATSLIEKVMDRYHQIHTVPKKSQ